MLLADVRDSGDFFGDILVFCLTYKRRDDIFAREPGGSPEGVFSIRYSVFGTQDEGLNTEDSTTESTEHGTRNTEKEYSVFGVRYSG